METVIDVETTVVMLHGKKDSSPYRPHTRLVSVGLEYEGRADYFCIYHTHQPSSEGAVEAIQKVLDDTTLLIGHNIKFDFNWMRSCGFKYDRKIYDTMNWEYLHAGGVRGKRLDLSSCCKRHQLPTKQDEAAAYFADGVGYDEMPWEVVEAYGRNDVAITRMLYDAQNS